MPFSKYITIIFFLLCYLTASAEFTVSSTQATGGQCNGTATVTASTGLNGPYTYSWSNGKTTATVTGLCAGTYTVFVSNAFGCQTRLTVAVTMNCTGLTASQQGMSITCPGTNGTALVGNSWNVSALYKWSSGYTSTGIVSFASLAAGSYTVTATINGCTASANVSLQNYPAMNLSISTAKACPGVTFPFTNFTTPSSNGNANALISGGSAPYSYIWSNGQTTSTINAQAGTYTLTVTDKKGCKKIGTAVIETSPQMGVTGTTYYTCEGENKGKVVINATGGSSPLTYNWSNGATTSNINNLTTGQYTLTVTDAAGCMKLFPAYISSAPRTVIIDPYDCRNRSIYCGNNLMTAEYKDYTIGVVEDCSVGLYCPFTGTEFTRLQGLSDTVTTGDSELCHDYITCYIPEIGYFTQEHETYFPSHSTLNPPPYPCSGGEYYGYVVYRCHGVVVEEGCRLLSPATSDSIAPRVYPSESFLTCSPSPFDDILSVKFSATTNQEHLCYLT